MKRPWPATSVVSTTARQRPNDTLSQGRRLTHYDTEFHAVKTCGNLLFVKVRENWLEDPARYRAMNLEFDV